MPQSQLLTFHAIAVQVDQIYRDLDKRDRFALSQYLFGLSMKVNVTAQGEDPSLFKSKEGDRYQPSHMGSRRKRATALTSLTNYQLPTMRDFAKKRVFATSDRSGEIQQGLTYREWLIGMTLSGYAARPGKNGDGVEPVEIAELAIQAADSAIEQMEVEQKLEDLSYIRLQEIQDQLLPHSGTLSLIAAVANRDDVAIDEALATLPEEVQTNLRPICDRLLNS